jgi:hypothetical protein
MTNYAALSLEELHQYINTSPVDTGAYLKASAELNRRLNVSGHKIATFQMIYGVVLHFWTKLWPF